MLEPGLFLVARNLLSGKAYLFCFVLFFPQQHYHSWYCHGAAGRSYSGGVAWHVPSTVHSTPGAPCCPRLTGMAQCLDSIIVWNLPAVCHPEGSLATPELSHVALILPSPLKPLTGGWTGGDRVVWRKDRQRSGKIVLLIRLQLPNRSATVFWQQRREL